MAMKTKVITAGLSALTMLLLLVPLEAGAAVHGVGAHPFHPRGHFAPHHFGHFARHRFFRHRQVFGVWPWYGYYDGPSYPYDDYSTPQVVVVPEREPARTACQHSEQTVTVPSANGGTGQVTILRC